MKSFIFQASRQNPATRDRRNAQRRARVNVFVVIYLFYFLIIMKPFIFQASRQNPATRDRRNTQRRARRRQQVNVFVAINSLYFF